MKPRNILAVGFALVLSGAVLPFLILMGVFPSTFFLNILAYAVSVSGLILGVVGAAQYVNRRDDEHY